eukprot:1708333-Pyramimonas_sp.AAC.1
MSEAKSTGTSSNARGREETLVWYSGAAMRCLLDCSQCHGPSGDDPRAAPLERRPPRPPGTRSGSSSGAASAGAE